MLRAYKADDTGVFTDYNAVFAGLDGLTVVRLVYHHKGGRTVENGCKDLYPPCPSQSHARGTSYQLQLE